MSRPSGWIRLPSATSWSRSASHEERDLVGRGRHVGVGEDDDVGVRGEHPGPDRGALAAVGDRQQREGRPSPRLTPAGLRAGTDERGGAVGAPVVHDEDVDVRRQVTRARRPVAAEVGPPAQVAEELVEGRPEAVLLVVGGQDDGQARRVHGGSVYGRPPTRAIRRKSPIVRTAGTTCGATPSNVRIAA